ELAAAESEEPAAEPTATTPSSYEVGDIISIGDTVFVVLGWNSPEGDQFTQPDEGKKFVLLDLLFVNQGENTRSISTLLQMKLKDGTAQQYDIDLMASVAGGGNSPDGELNPGERIRGQVGFQVPADASGLEFVFDADIFGSGKVFVQLGDEPISVEPPEALAGETAQKKFAIGDIIEIGDLVLTVNEVRYQTGDDFNQPDEGQQFLVVDLTIENVSSETQSVSTLAQMSLKDETGQTYDVDLMAMVAADGSAPEGEFALGETIRGPVAFQVPSDAAGLTFEFDADLFGSGKVLVDLTTAE
ncbi:MAG: DUF4352 domain-containing protein, partial [Anaerolineales bacterium]|nr:DUF4352 domain-containing protein [Anaerolineales bacterium]